MPRRRQAWPKHLTAQGRHGLGFKLLQMLRRHRDAILQIGLVTGQPDARPGVIRHDNPPIGRCYRPRRKLQRLACYASRAKVNHKLRPTLQTQTSRLNFRTVRRGSSSELRGSFGNLSQTSGIPNSRCFSCLGCGSHCVFCTGDASDWLLSVLRSPLTSDLTSRKNRPPQSKTKQAEHSSLTVTGAITGRAYHWPKGENHVCGPNS